MAWQRASGRPSRAVLCFVCWDGYTESRSMEIGVTPEAPFVKVGWLPNKLETGLAFRHGWGNVYPHYTPLCYTADWCSDGQRALSWSGPLTRPFLKTHSTAFSLNSPHSCSQHSSNKATINDVMHKKAITSETYYLIIFGYFYVTSAAE